MESLVLDYVVLMSAADWLYKVIFMGARVNLDVT
jgi:hypothetical protein